MPKSRVRKKKVYTPPAELRPRAATAAAHRPSPTWLPIVAALCFLVGVAWLVVYYLSETMLPVAAWGYWNLGIGFGWMVLSMLVFTRWR